MYRYRVKTKISDYISGTYLSMIIFIAIFVAFIYAVGSISSDTTERQEKSLDAAINRGIVSCYFVEGTYPPSLAYLKEHYGLTDDEESFFVDYRPIGANIYPEVAIIRRDK